MKAGRELDALVAERVMGWTGITHTRWGPRGDEPGDGGRTFQSIPPFSDHIGWAWDVMEWFWRFDGSAHVGKSPGITDDPPPEGGWYGFFWGCDEMGPNKAVWEAVSAPHAICLAALKAVEGRE